MPKDLSKRYKLLVISDTGMFLENNQWYAFGPVVTELNHFLSIFSEITWIGFNRLDQKENSSYKLVNTDKIRIIALKRVGGVDLKSKAKILLNYPNMWSKIDKEVKQHQFIHVRAPSNPAVIAMQLSKKYKDKKFWFKYAGSWVDKTSKSYNWQREQLKKLNSNAIVTVNGNWENQPKNILAFDNPCLENEDRILGKKVVDNKVHKHHLNICFVGGLNKNKGILDFISVLKLINNDLYGEIDVVGDGSLKEILIKKSRGEKVNFHGYLSKKEVISIYEKCHFIILPSKSEGFPKVISEAMNYGCIPIVSNVSGISQVVSHRNGFLLQNTEAAYIAEVLKTALSIDEKSYNIIIKNNYKIANNFTYQVYLDRMSKEIFNFEN